MGDRCTGLCCRKFSLPKSPDDLAALYRAYQSGSTVWMDIPVIATMVRLEEVREVPPGEKPPDQPAKDGRVYYYSCVHLTEAGDCGIYAMRPRLCREFPYGEPCRFEGCEWDAGREGRHGEHQADQGWSDHRVAITAVPKECAGCHQKFLRLRHSRARTCDAKCRRQAARELTGAATAG